MMMMVMMVMVILVSHLGLPEWNLFRWPEDEGSMEYQQLNDSCLRLGTVNCADVFDVFDLHVGTEEIGGENDG